jgi:4,5-dihydroxyphthalate decarboxylase
MMPGHARPLTLMIGRYPHTEALHSGRISSDTLDLQVATVTNPSEGFHDVIALKYDCAELPVPTFLMAREAGLPLSALPADLFCRKTPPALYYKATHGRMTPRDLNGKRLGVNYFSAATSIWAQCLLANAGVDLDSLKWVATSPPLVTGFADPPSVEYRPGAALDALLTDGEVEAIVSVNPPRQPGISPLGLEPDLPSHLPLPPDFRSHHLLVARTSVLQADPGAARTLWRLLLNARAETDLPDGENPYGVEDNRGHIETALTACHQLGFIAKSTTVDALFSDFQQAFAQSA